MKVKDLLEIQGIIDNRIIPNDMNDNKLNEHYSESKGEFMSILDMDLIHLVRSYSKCIGQKQKQDNEIYLDKYSWDYSNTTSRYRKFFLQEDTKTTRDKINKGIYILEDLN